MTKLLLLLFLLSLQHITQAQTAKVIELSPDDQEKAKVIQIMEDQLADRKKKFDTHIKATYLAEEHKESTFYLTTGSKSYKDGWETGEYEFSDDYKYIVPKHIIPSMNTTCYFPVSW